MRGSNLEQVVEELRDNRHLFSTEEWRAINEAARMVEDGEEVPEAVADELRVLHDRL